MEGWLFPLYVYGYGNGITPNLISPIKSLLIMDIRNLSRVLVFRKALHSYNKKGNNSFHSTHVFVLLSIYTIGDCTLWKLQDYLKSFYRTYSPKQLQDYLKPLLSSGLVISYGKHPVLYTLTLEGKNTLFQLEKRVRETRKDR